MWSCCKTKQSHRWVYLLSKTQRETISVLFLPKFRVVFGKYLQLSLLFLVQTGGSTYWHTNTKKFHEILHELNASNFFLFMNEIIHHAHFGIVWIFLQYFKCRNEFPKTVLILFIFVQFSLLCFCTPYTLDL